MAKDSKKNDSQATDESNTVDTVDSAGTSSASLDATDASTAHTPESDQAHQDARSSGESDGGHGVLGSTSNPAAEPQAAQDTGFDTAPQNATQVGSATDLNAFRQELEDERASAHNAVDEIYGKAVAYVDRFQNNPQNQS